MKTPNTVFALIATILSGAALSGCSSEAAGQARDLCLVAVSSEGGGVGEAEIGSIRGWDDEGASIVVQGNWMVSEGEQVVGSSGEAAEWRGGYLYPWTCTVEAGQVSRFEFAWGPQDVAVVLPAKGVPDADPEPVTVAEPCLVKGNVSFDSGERIYHVPGQDYYDQTVINKAYGERWFCTEKEAIDAGWRKART